MSFELINEIEEKYPEEYFTRDSVIKANIVAIIDKFKLKIEELEARIEELEK